jgi:hypothetical protein
MSGGRWFNKRRRRRNFEEEKEQRMKTLIKKDGESQ